MVNIYDKYLRDKFSNDADFYWRTVQYSDILDHLPNISGYGSEWGSDGSRVGYIADMFPNVTWSSLAYPPFDICDPDCWIEDYDICIADNVLEHVNEPWKVIENMGNHCKCAIIAVPFMVHIHGCPGDYWRMTPDCIRWMAEPYFKDIYINSWGTLQANNWFDLYRNELYNVVPEYLWRAELQKNDPSRPFHIWAILQK